MGPSGTVPVWGVMVLVPGILVPIWRVPVKLNYLSIFRKVLYQGYQIKVNKSQKQYLEFLVLSKNEQKELRIPNIVFEIYWPLSYIFLIIVFFEPLYILKLCPFLVGSALCLFQKYENLLKTSSSSVQNLANFLLQNWKFQEYYPVHLMGTNNTNLEFLQRNFCLFILWVFLQGKCFNWGQNTP